MKVRARTVPLGGPPEHGDLLMITRAFANRAHRRRQSGTHPKRKYSSRGVDLPHKHAATSPLGLLLDAQGVLVPFDDDDDEPSLRIDKFRAVALESCEHSVKDPQ